MAENSIGERKRGAPWMLMTIMLVVAAVIGWLLWSNRSRGEPTTGTPADAVADSTPGPTQPGN